MNDLRLASLLCTRLCHDVVGPIGAINNGLELLDDPSAGMDEEVIDLVRRSAGESARRLQFFRAAFGLSRGSSGTTGIGDVKKLADGLFAGGKVKLDWFEGSLPAEPVASGTLRQLLLNLVLCASETLPRGGCVTVRFAKQDDALLLQVTGVGVSVNVTDALRQGLSGSGDVDGLDPRSVQPYLAGQLAAAMGSALDLTQPAEDSVVISTKFAIET